HVELGAAACHPNMQGKHVVVVPGEDFIARLNDQSIALIVEPIASMIGGGGCFLQNGIGSNHFARHQILADAEMLKRALSLSAPPLVRRPFNHTKAVGLFSHADHFALPGLDTSLAHLAQRPPSCRLWPRRSPWHPA